MRQRSGARVQLAAITPGEKLLPNKTGEIREVRGVIANRHRRNIVVPRDT